ncbi:MAG: hypothetical protein JWP35_4309 [Caulobacter sp.]|nr:hypothetical protein [Caulobacter sp.]
MILGLVLAGGRSERFGSEKAMAEMDGRPLVAIAAERLALGSEAVAVSARPASGAAAWAEDHGLPVLYDEPGDADGPLAGVRAGLIWARARGADSLATLPCDVPFAPDDLMKRLKAALDGHLLAFAQTDQGPQPLCAIWKVAALALLTQSMADGAHPPVRQFASMVGANAVRFEDAGAFANFNRASDIP